MKHHLPTGYPIMTLLEQTRTFVLVVCLFVPVSSAASFTVNSTADAVDAKPGDGICATVTGACTLRAAIQETNALAGADTIVVPAGTYILTIPGRGETAAASGDLDITDNLTISGAGADSTIVEPCTPSPVTSPCAGIDRVFHVDPNGARINVTISGMTIQNGTTVVIPFVSANGGAVLLGVAQTLGSPVPSGQLTLNDCVIRTSSTPRDGGGIFNNAGALTLVRTTVTTNSAGNGGGIANGDMGIVNLTSSTISNNTADQGGGMFSGYFDIAGSTKVTLTNSTISGNTTGTGPGTGSGAGIFANRGLFNITNTTISDNVSFYSGGGIVVGATNATVVVNNSTIAGNRVGTSQAGGSGAGLSGNVTASNSIFAGNTLVGSPSDCSGRILSGGYNLIQNTAGCTITGTTTGNILNQDAKLGPLAGNGGPTQARPLLAGSPAIDAGNPAIPGSGPGACALSDQFGILRPQASRCDIGALERLSGLSITAMTPGHVAIGALVPAVILGGGFAPGAAVSLQRTGQAPVAGSAVTIGSAGATASALFDLTGRPAGIWDVTVSNPDGSSATLAAAVTADATAVIDVWVSTVANSVVRIGPTALITVFFGNRGNTDAFAVPLVVSMPSTFTGRLPFAIWPPPAQAGQVATDWTQVPIGISTPSSGNFNLSLLIPAIPAGYAGAIQIPFKINSGSEGQAFTVLTAAGNPYFVPTLDPEIVAGLTAGAQAYAQDHLGVAIAPQHVPQMNQYVTTQLQTIIQNGRNALLTSFGAQGQIYSLGQIVFDLARFGASL